MAEALTPGLTPGVTPGLKHARHAVAAGQRALACGHGQLSWTLLRQWPAWALETDAADADTRALWRRLGLRWHARALRRSIDGAAWVAAEATAPRSTIDAAVQAAGHDRIDLGAPQLPPADALAAQFERTGRDIAVAAIEPPALRAAVAAATGAATLRLDAATAQQLLDWAAALPQHDEGSSP
jgi:hypothetical protein